MSILFIYSLPPGWTGPTTICWCATTIQASPPFETFYPPQNRINHLFLNPNAHVSLLQDHRHIKESMSLTPSTHSWTHTLPLPQLPIKVLGEWNVLSPSYSILLEESIMPYTQLLDQTKYTQNIIWIPKAGTHRTP